MEKRERKQQFFFSKIKTIYKIEIRPNKKKVETNQTPKNCLAYLLWELFPHSMVKSSIAVQDLRRSLFKPIVCCVGHMPLLAAAVKSGNDGHDENKRDALN